MEDRQAACPSGTAIPSLFAKSNDHRYNVIRMAEIKDAFTRFEHVGWERVADKYDSVWSSLTRQFIPHLISAAQVSPTMSVLDVACGPGYVSAAVKILGAVPTGIDFSKKRIAIAKTMFPNISFLQGDAQELPFGNASFDRVLITSVCSTCRSPKTRVPKYVEF
jgi:ubiquinone/menaquinone biosynthesis C-methylase UbiE